MVDPTVPPDDERTSSPLPDVDASGQVRPVDLRDYVSFSPNEAQRVRVFATEELALDLWCIQPQQSTEVLRYSGADVTYTVLGGRSWFVTEQGEIGLDPLGSMLIPAGVTHGIDNRGADPLIVVASSSPPGEAKEDLPVDNASTAIRIESKQPGRLRRALDNLFGD